MATVLVDGRSAVHPRTTGWERYARSLLAHLKDDEDLLWRRWASRNAHVGAATRVWQDVVSLPRLARRHHASFFPTFPPAIESQKPTYWTVHDLTWLRHPEWSSPLGRTYYSRLARRRLSGRVHVVTVSDSVKAELIAWGLPERRVTRIYPGVSTRLLELEPAREDVLPNRPFVMCVATSEPRKNLQTLARAWADSDISRRYELVVAGRLGWGQLPAGVRHVDSPDDAGLAALYRSAAACVIPSFYEGFGLPVIEAMLFGLPVACSDIPVFREVTGGNADFFPPDDGQRMLTAVAAAVDRGRQSPPALLDQYSWSAAARQLTRLVKEGLVKGDA